MKKDEILSVFKRLSMSQGYYGRILNMIEECPEYGEKYLANLEEQNFSNELDLIMYVECA